MKIALYCGIALCAWLVLLGVVILFSDATIAEKLILSPLAILSGVAFGSMGISMLRDD